MVHITCGNKAPKIPDAGCNNCDELEQRVDTLEKCCEEVQEKLDHITDGCIPETIIDEDIHYGFDPYDLPPYYELTPLTESDDDVFTFTCTSSTYPEGYTVTLDWTMYADIVLYDIELAEVSITIYRYDGKWYFSSNITDEYHMKIETVCPDYTPLIVNLSGAPNDDGEYVETDKTAGEVISAYLQGRPVIFHYLYGHYNALQIEQEQVVIRYYDIVQPEVAQMVLEAPRIDRKLYYPFLM